MIKNIQPWVTHTGIVIVAEKYKYNPPKKGMEQERNLSLDLYSINSEYIIEKTGHGKMVYA